MGRLTLLIPPAGRHRTQDRTLASKLDLVHHVKGGQAEGTYLLRKAFSTVM